MKHIGFLMVRNEADVLPETLAHHAARFDCIVAQDGSDDGGRKLIETCPQVVRCFHDEDVLREGERWSDGHRNHALQWIMENYGVEDVWIHLLHADEFWEDEPVPAAEAADAAGATFVLWGEYRFFLHVTDRGRPERGPVRRRVTYYAGPFFEVRQFKLQHHQLYTPGADHCVLPAGPGPTRRWATIPRYRHYPYRSERQARLCYLDKVVARYWQPDHAWLGAHDPYRQALPKPANSPLAQWHRVACINDTPLPEPGQFLPGWWKEPWEKAA